MNNILDGQYYRFNIFSTGGVISVSSKHAEKGHLFQPVVFGFVLVAVLAVLTLSDTPKIKYSTSIVSQEASMILRKYNTSNKFKKRPEETTNRKRQYRKI